MSPGEPGAAAAAAVTAAAVAAAAASSSLRRAADVTDSRKRERGQECEGMNSVRAE